MPTKTLQSSSPNAGQNPAILPTQDLAPELLQKLSALGIDLDSLPEANPQVAGIGSALGPEKDQAALDAWIAAGGTPFAAG